MKIRILDQNINRLTPYNVPAIDFGLKIDILESLTFSIIDIWIWKYTFLAQNYVFKLNMDKIYSRWLKNDIEW